MSPRTFRVNDYSYSRGDRLFFDANVWLFLFGPQYSPWDPRVRPYSAAFKKVLAARCSLFIDVLVLSEFVNRSAKYAYNTLPASEKPQKFKIYRSSPDFRRVAKRIAGDCRRIVNHCTPMESGFAALDLHTLLSEYELAKADLNDLVLARLCTAKGLMFVTDDADFKGQGLNLLTANSKLLRK